MCGYQLDSPAVKIMGVGVRAWVWDLMTGEKRGKDSMQVSGGGGGGGGGIGRTNALIVA